MLLSDLGNEVIAEVAADPSDPDIPTLIFGFMRAGMRTIPALIRGRMLTNRQTFNMPANASSFDLSTLSPSFIRENGLWYTDNNNKKVPIIRLSVNEFKRFQDLNATTYPKFYNISVKTLWIDTPVGGILPIEIDYFCGITDAITNASIFNLGEDFIELVKKLTKSLYYEYQEDSDKMMSNKQDAKILIDELDARYTEQELGDFPDES